MEKKRIPHLTQLLIGHINRRRYKDEEKDQGDTADYEQPAFSQNDIGAGERISGRREKAYSCFTMQICLSFASVSSHLSHKNKFAKMQVSDKWR